LKDVDQKLFVPFSLHDLLRCFLDGSGDPSGEEFQVRVRLSGGIFDEAQGMDHFSLKSPTADRKILDGPLCLGAIVGPSRDFDETHGVPLHSIETFRSGHRKPPSSFLSILVERRSFINPHEEYRGWIF
jgi:hypothetical protein